MFATKVYVQPFLYAPVQAGDCVGRVDLFVNGEKVSTRSLVAAENVAAVTRDCNEWTDDEKPKTLSEKIKAFLRMFR